MAFRSSSIPSNLIVALTPAELWGVIAILSVRVAVTSQSRKRSRSRGQHVYQSVPFIDSRSIYPMIFLCIAIRLCLNQEAFVIARELSAGRKPEIEIVTI